MAKQDREEQWHSLYTKIISEGRKAWEQLPGENLREYNSFILWLNINSDIKAACEVAAKDPTAKESYGSVNPSTWSTRSGKWFWIKRRELFNRFEASQATKKLENIKSEAIDDRLKDAMRYRDSQRFLTSLGYEALLKAMPRIVNRIKKLDLDNMKDREVIQSLKILIECFEKVNGAAEMFLGIDEVIAFLSAVEEGDDGAKA